VKRAILLGSPIPVEDVKAPAPKSTQKPGWSSLYTNWAHQPPLSPPEHAPKPPPTTGSLRDRVQEMAHAHLMQKGVYPTHVHLGDVERHELIENMPLHSFACGYDLAPGEQGMFFYGMAVVTVHLPSYLKVTRA
jgi:hypothetical protein